MKQALLAALLVFVGPATAQVLVDDGDMLWASCRVPGVTHYAYCVGYIRGVLARSNIDQNRYCLPQDETRNLKLSRAVIEYLETEPRAERHYPAVWLVMNALEKSFPCPRPKP